VQSAAEQIKSELWRSPFGNEMEDLGKSVGNKNKGGEVKDFG